jgi:hypothetical protein
MQSNLAEKLERPDGESLEGLSEEELFKMAFPGKEMPIEEHRRIRRALAKARGTTLEEEMDEMERLTGSRKYVNALRLLLGIEVKCDHTPADHIQMLTEDRLNG